MAGSEKKLPTKGSLINIKLLPSSLERKHKVFFIQVPIPVTDPVGTTPRSTSQWNITKKMGSDSLWNIQHFVRKNKLSISALWRHRKLEMDGETEKSQIEDMFTSLLHSRWVKVLVSDNRMWIYMVIGQLRAILYYLCLPPCWGFPTSVWQLISY